MECCENRMLYANQNISWRQISFDKLMPSNYKCTGATADVRIVRKAVIEKQSPSLLEYQLCTKYFRVVDLQITATWR